MDVKSKNDGPCEFRCHEDFSCIPSWSQVCDGHSDCADHSDEAECPYESSLVQPPPNPLAKPYVDLMQEISGVQICIVAVALVLTLGLITCVINHYKQFGARSWSRDQRRHKSSRKSKRCATPSVLYSPAKVNEQMRRETILHQEHELRMLSVQRDFEYNLPVHVSHPVSDGGYFRPSPQKPGEAPRVYIQPPPNRTVTAKDKCKIPEIPSPHVHKSTARSSSQAETPNLVIYCPTVPHTSTRPAHDNKDYALDKWQPPGTDMCTIHLFTEAMDLVSNDPPPKYEDIICHRPQGKDDH